MESVSDTSKPTEDLFRFPRSRANGVYNDKPYFGPRLNLKSEDAAKNLPTLRYCTHVHKLNMSKPEDLRIYERISQAAFDGDILVSFDERQYDPELKDWVVFIRWAEIYYATPAAATT